MPSTRRQFLAGASIAGLAVAGCLSRGPPSGELQRVDGTWSMVGGDAGHTRTVAEGPADPDTVWATELPEARTVGTPAVVDDALYVPVDAVADEARYRYRIHKLDALTGSKRWQVPLRAEPNGPPAVVDENVVVSARLALEHGRVVCFDQRYGEEQWLFDIDARVTAPPTVSNGVVYVPDWRGRVFALSLSDGSRRWSRRFGTEDAGRTFSEPVAVSDGTLYLGSRSGATGVLAVDAATGEKRWTKSTASVRSGPVVTEGLVVVRAGQLVVAFDSDGTRQWSFNISKSDAGPLAIDDQYLYVPARDRLVAITRNGDEAWRYEPTEGRFGTPTAVGDTVVLRGDGRVTAVSRSDGTETWRSSLEGTGGAVVTPGGIFVSGSGGRLSALGGGDG
jgi:outer membrane protein assembly factor BamB